MACISIMNETAIFKPTQLDTHLVSSNHGLYFYRGIVILLLCLVMFVDWFNPLQSQYHFAITELNACRNIVCVIFKCLFLFSVVLLLLMLVVENQF